MPFFAALFLCSCAAPTAYYKNLNNLTATGNFSEAAELTDKSFEKVYGKKNLLLYYFDKGMFLHLAGKYGESNAVFEKAKKLAENYFTKSVTTEASTFLVSDNTRPYYGEDFERALIHVFSALNYALLENDNEALVEARQVDHFLKTLQTNYGYKNIYKEDAFARYLMGMIYENKGQTNDAFISYRKALESYDDNIKHYDVAVPGQLVDDTLRTAGMLGFRDEAKQIENKWGKYASKSRLNAGNGEIIILHYNGIAPVKVDSFFEISFGKAWIYVDSVQTKGEEEAQVEQAKAIARGILAKEQVRMAFPKYLQSNYEIKNFLVELKDCNDNKIANSSGELVENIGAIAINNLDDRIARIRTKTIARAAIKFALTQKINQKVEQQSGDKTLNWLVKKALSAAATASELADKRSWRSLPDNISITRLQAPPGEYNLKIDFQGRTGATIESRTLNNISIKSKKKTFLIVRTIL